jgi:hypothetical protein
MLDVRTTLTLDDDVARLLNEAIHRERRSMKQVVNDALRRALGPVDDRQQEPYRLVPHESAVRPGFDLTSLNRLADELEEGEILDKLHRAS